MTRKEYMEALKAQLGFMAEENRQALLDFYGEMLEDRMEDGMDEASAVQAMESPEAIAQRVRSEAPAEEESQEEKPKEEAPRAEAQAVDLDDEAMQFSSLTNKILKTTEELLQEVPVLVNQGLEQAKDVVDAERPEEEVAQKLRQTAESMEKSSLGSLARKLREAADSMERQAQDQAPEESRAQTRSAGQTSGEYQIKILTCAASQLRAVSLQCSEMPILIKACEGGEAKLTYYTCDRDPYEAGVENGVLSLRRLGQSRSAGRFHFTLFGSVFSMGWNQSVPTVELLLPADALVDLRAATHNGSIRLEGLGALCQTELETSNSRITVAEVNCKTLDAKTSNSRVVLEKVASKQDIQCKTSNSRIEAVGVKCGGSAVLTTSNGRIVVSGTRARGEMRLTTSNSSIETAGADAAKLTLKTSNGSIRGTLAGSQGDWAIQSHTSNGKNTLPKEQPGSKPLEAYTSNGNINIAFLG